MRKINADSLIRSLEWCRDEGVGIGGWDDIIRIVRLQRTVKTGKVRSAFWHEAYGDHDGHGWYCDACNTMNHYTSRYCPHCGAHMEGVIPIDMQKEVVPSGHEEAAAGSPDR